MLLGLFGRHLQLPPDALAWRLTSSLFDRLHSGGTFLASNFLADNANRAFMESLMDWHVVTRDERQLMQLVSELPAVQIGERSIFTDAGKNIAYLEVIER